LKDRAFSFVIEDERKPWSACNAQGGQAHVGTRDRLPALGSLCLHLVSSTFHPRTHSTAITSNTITNPTINLSFLQSSAITSLVATLSSCLSILLSTSKHRSLAIMDSLQGFTMDDLGLDIKLEGPEGQEFKERIDSAGSFEDLGLYGILFYSITPVNYQIGCSCAVR
jgi:hypothetical protein